MIPLAHYTGTSETGEAQTHNRNFKNKPCPNVFFSPDGVQHIQRTSPEPNCKRDGLHGLHYRNYPKRWNCTHRLYYMHKFV